MYVVKLKAAVSAFSTRFVSHALGSGGAALVDRGHAVQGGDAVRACWALRLSSFADKLQQWKDKSDDTTANSKGMADPLFDRLRFLSYDYCDLVHEALAGPVLFVDPDTLADVSVDQA